MDPWLFARMVWKATEILHASAPMFMFFLPFARTHLLTRSAFLSVLFSWSLMRECFSMTWANCRRRAIVCLGT